MATLRHPWTPRPMHFCQKSLDRDSHDVSIEMHLTRRSCNAHLIWTVCDTVMCVIVLWGSIPIRQAIWQCSRVEVCSHPAPSGTIHLSYDHCTPISAGHTALSACLCTVGILADSYGRGGAMFQASALRTASATHSSSVTLLMMPAGGL